ncbi:dihydromonapterin reductase [Shewanella avicenniae]|uniref:Dihydromonapterin reductase n=1 Tax=Shewanella avicenniae TaxID=2814294 RepID=A0ABX7QSG3_9GAMM|nr:dihydromonapterin reductase [Shewanella avicenniae]QSX34397.1 dihydromonapterin reductase [Shewanella avicenniae]
MATVLITGVGKRLGLALAHALLDDGYKVIGTYRSDYPSLQGLREKGASLYQLDLLDDAALNQLISDITQQHKTLRAIVHNASDWLSEKSAAPAEVFDAMLGIHARVPYLLNLALAPLLQQGATASSDIIHVTDYVAQKGSAKHLAYAASKAALENLTQSFAAKLAPQVKVNSIAPALMLFNELDDADYRDKTLSKALLPKEGGEQEFIEAVRYLFASGYMTGQSLHLDGGRALK